MILHDTLLLACGNAESRSALRDIFSESYNLLEADNCQQTMLLLAQNMHCIASVLLDITVPEKIDESVLTAPEQVHLLHRVPVIVIAPSADTQAVANAFAMGAMEAITDDYDPYVLLRRVQNIVQLHRHKWHLEELAQEQAAILQHSNDAMVDVLSSLIEYRSVESGQHILRIRRFTQILLQELQRSSPRYELTDKTIQIISSAAALHDIGKISIPDAVLNKPGKLTWEEWEIMKSHSDVGSRIIRTLGDLADQEYLRYAYNICRYHHERWDGGGYPEGIRGDNIPICAQVVGLADAYDALTTKRVYKDAISYDRATNMICNGECGGFSPRLLECFKHVAGKFAEVAGAYADGQSPKAERFDTKLPAPSPKEELDALQVTRAKYQTLMHYVDATVLEVNPEQGTFHLVYNPDPNLTVFSEINSFDDWLQAIVQELVLPEERKKMLRLLYEEMPRFLREGMLRMTERFHIISKTTGRILAYDISVLQQRRGDPQQSQLIIIWKRLREEEADRPTDSWQTNEAIRSLLPVRCHWKNNTALTVVEYDEDLQTLLGYGKEDFYRICGGNVMDLVAPEDQQGLGAQIQEQIEVGRKVEAEFRLRRANDTYLWVMCRMYLQMDDDGTESFHGILLDISASMEKRQKLHRKLEQYQIILSQTENVLFEWDIQRDEIDLSANWEEIFGYEPLRRSLLEHLYTDTHFHPEDIALLMDGLRAIYAGEDYQLCEVRIAKADGRYLWSRIRATAIRSENGQLKKIVGVIINIDEEKRSAQALQDRAERDVLTKLLNKTAARRQAEEYIAGNGNRCALFIIDLDNFKQINDRYGHMFGDAVLTQIAKEIRKLFRAQDIVARIGGDEFMVLMRGISDRTLVENRCSQLVAAFRNAMLPHLNGEHLSCSVGVSLCPQHGQDYSGLFRKADQALYATKGRGKDGYTIFDEEDIPAAKNLVSAINEHIDSEDVGTLLSNTLLENTFRKLYNAKDLDAALDQALAAVGEQMQVSRVYIFENSPDNQRCSNTFEWCNQGIQPEIDSLQNVSYSVDIPNFIAQFDENGIFYCPNIMELPRDLRDILAVQNIKSVLHCAIRDNGVVRGFVGFDDCLHNRYWTKEQIDVLTMFSELLSLFLLKKRAQDAVSRLEEG